jgi:hypothetical protein
VDLFGQVFLVVVLLVPVVQVVLQQVELVVELVVVVLVVVLQQLQAQVQNEQDHFYMVVVNHIGLIFLALQDYDLAEYLSP